MKDPKRRTQMLLYGVGGVLIFLALIWIIQGTPIQG